MRPLGATVRARRRDSCRQARACGSLNGPPVPRPTARRSRASRGCARPPRRPGSKGGWRALGPTAAQSLCRMERLASLLAPAHRPAPLTTFQPTPLTGCRRPCSCRRPRRSPFLDAKSTDGRQRKSRRARWRCRARRPRAAPAPHPLAHHPRLVRRWPRIPPREGAHRLHRRVALRRRGSGLRWSRASQEPAPPLS